MDRERWRSVCHGHPLEGRFRRERGVGAIDIDIEGPNRRGRPLVRWEDKVREYVNEKGNWARRECIGRER